MKRGINKESFARWSEFRPRCAAMLVGSVPHREVRPALDIVLETAPEVPTWPQLPRRSFLENMYVQFSEGLPGLQVDVATEKMVEHSELPDVELMTFAEALETNDPAFFAVSPDYAAGLYALPSLLERLEGPVSLLKGQITGPISFCLQVTDQDRRPILYDDTTRELATELLTARARWQQEFLQAMAPGAAVLIMVDEPFLAQWGSGYLSMPEDVVVSLLDRMAGILDCLVGIHICGGTDWSKVAKLPLDVLNFDAADHLDAIVAHAEAVATFVAEGGMLAWGVVPNDERVLTLEPKQVADSVVEGAGVLASTGLVSRQDVLLQSFVAPACGTGALSIPIAEACLRLNAATSQALRSEVLY